MNVISVGGGDMGILMDLLNGNARNVGFVIKHQHDHKIHSLLCYTVQFGKER